MIAIPSCFRAFVALLGTAILGLSLVSGCACGNRHCNVRSSGGGYFGLPSPVCFGHASTCWHAWPVECTSCPTYNFPPQIAEPLPAKAPPAIEPAAEPALPVPEPSPSDQRQSEENKQSRRRMPPSVLTVEPSPAAANPQARLQVPQPVESAPAFEPTVPSVHYERPVDEQAAPPLVAEPFIETPAAPSTPIERPVAEVRTPVASSNAPSIYDHSEPETVAARQPAPAKRPRFQLPALFNLVTAPSSHKATVAKHVESAASKPIETTSRIEPAVEAAPFFAPPPPVIIELPPASAPPVAPIQVTTFEAPPRVQQSEPEMIINPAVSPAHQPPPPVLIAPPLDNPPSDEAPSEETTFTEALPIETPAVELPIEVAAPVQTFNQPSHIISDWRFAEPALPPIVASPRLDQPQQPLPEMKAVDTQPHLAPIVSPASILRRQPPVRAQ